MALKEASATNIIKTADESVEIEIEIDKSVQIEIEIEIPTNNASKFVASDVARVVHVPSKSRIEVHLNDYDVRECKNPMVLGRISGWSISSFVMGFGNDDNNRSILIGTYDRSTMPVAGTYYLELIVMLCERYDDDEDSVKSVDLRQLCLYDHGTGTEYHHMITQFGSSIDVSPMVDKDMGDSSPPPPDDNTSPRMGRWIYKNLLETVAPNYGAAVDSGPTTAALDLELPPPLYTRYQVSKYSMFPEGWTFLFDNYTYQWNNLGPSADLDRPDLYYPSNIVDTTDLAPLKVCFVGSSHSRVLKNACLRMLNASSIESQDLGCKLVWVNYPNNVTDDSTEIRSTIEEAGCTHAIFGLYQWYFSHHSKHRIFWGDFEEALTGAIRVLDDIARDPETRLRRVLLRSLHPNGLGFAYSACPPTDFRTFPNTDFATSVVKKIAEDFSSEAKKNNVNEVVSFLDTRFLMDPVWDSNMDWSHYDWEVSEIEAKFMVSEIMNEEWVGTTTSLG